MTRKELLHRLYRKKYFTFSKRGFTLIELMVVFSIAVLITGVGFASLLSYSRRQEVTQASANIKEVFKQAKFNALSFVKPTNSNCAIGDPLNSYSVKFGATGYQLTALCGDTNVSITKKELPQNVTYYAIDKSCDQVTYQTLSGAVAGTNSNPLPCFVGIQGYGIQQCFEVDESGNTNDVSCTDLPSPTPTLPPTPTPTATPTTTSTPTPTPACTDKDGDGYYTTTGCVAGYKGTVVDCNDNNSLVNPGSFGSTSPDPVVGWDYNCDGSIEVDTQYVYTGGNATNTFAALKQPSRSSSCPLSTGGSYVVPGPPKTATSSMCGTNVIGIVGDGSGGLDEEWSTSGSYPNYSCVAKIGYTADSLSPSPLMCR
jgi:prepilin-type N-terminal cleavage/methylation domain-containing protein